MNCKKVNQLLVSYLDNEVSPEEREAIQAHLSACSDCREELEALAETQREVRQGLNTVAVGASVSPRAWSVLKERIETPERNGLPIMEALKSRVRGTIGRLGSRPVRQKALASVVTVAIVVGLCLGISALLNKNRGSLGIHGSSSAPSGVQYGPSNSTEAQDIVAKSVSAMSNVNSYKLDMDVVNTWKMIDEPNLTGVTEWNGTKVIDISHREMKMNMSIGDTLLVNDEPWSMEMYIIRGWEYYNATSPGLYNPWDKTRLTDEIWARESQISYCNELLKTGSQANLLGSENIDGIDCYVLTLVPSTGSMIDWVASQGQPIGPQSDINYGGAISVERADAYQEGSVKLWVDKASYLPLKVETNAVFDGFIGGGVNSSYPPTTGHENSSFNGQMTFSAYNQPVSVQLPQEALNTQEHMPLWVWIAVGVGAVVILVVGVVVIRRRLTSIRA